MQILEGLLQQIGTGIVELSFATKVYALNAIFVGTYFYFVFVTVMSLYWLWRGRRSGRRGSLGRMRFCRIGKSFFQKIEITSTSSCMSCRYYGM
eukprot:384140-Pleurochrysis_carterae.AAC.1